MIEVRYMLPDETEPRVGFLGPGVVMPADATDISYRSVSAPVDGDYGPDHTVVTDQPDPTPRAWDGGAIGS